MKAGDYLFVYGTLRRGESADLINNMHVEFIDEDRINGLIYDLGWFPGVKMLPPRVCPTPMKIECSGDCDVCVPFLADLPTVNGDVFLIRDASITPQLDAYEGYPNLYGRIQTQTESGRQVWLYTYNHGVGDDRQIESGDWISHQSAAAVPARTAA